MIRKRIISSILFSSICILCLFQKASNGSGNEDAVQIQIALWKWSEPVKWAGNVRSEANVAERNKVHRRKSLNSSLHLFLSTPSFYLFVYVFVSFSFSCKLLLFRPSEPTLGGSQPTTSVPCFQMTATKRRGRVASTVWLFMR